MNVDPEPHENQKYCISVEGILPQSWSSHFDEAKISIDYASYRKPITNLTISVVDQAALRGILTTFWDMNLKLISVVPVE